MFNRATPLPKRYPIMPSTAADNMILLCEIGSTAHGVTDGNDDFDMMGIFVEPREFVLGTNKLDHWVASSGDDESQNTKEDVDITMYSLRKFAKLALAGNPSILNMFFAPVLETDKRTYDKPLGEILRDSPSIFLSQQAAPRYLGYMKGQMERLQGTRGQKSVKRPHLEEAYGYDTKYAYHILRLGIQGTELLTTGKISIPMSEKNREFLAGVRKGSLSKEEFMEIAADVENDLKNASRRSILPEHPDMKLVDQFLIEMHERQWYP